MTEIVSNRVGGMAVVVCGTFGTSDVDLIVIDIARQRRSSASKMAVLVMRFLCLVFEYNQNSFVDVRVTARQRRLSLPFIVLTT